MIDMTDMLEPPRRELSNGHILVIITYVTIPNMTKMLDPPRLELSNGGRHMPKRTHMSVAHVHAHVHTHAHTHVCSQVHARVLHLSTQTLRATCPSPRRSRTRPFVPNHAVMSSISASLTACPLCGYGRAGTKMTASARRSF